MRKFISQYDNPNESRFNFDLINSTYDDSLVDYIVDSCKSLEVLEQITFLGYNHQDDETKININNYIFSRSAKKGEVPTLMDMNPSRHSELVLRFRIDYNDETRFITKPILVPEADEQGYYTINGKKYFMLYQLVDSSTYTTAKALTLKSLMPVSLKRSAFKFKDATSASYTAPVYTVTVFNNDINIFLFYLAKFGGDKALQYFSLENIVKFVDANGEKDPDCLYFNLTSAATPKIQLEVNRHFFNKHQYVQSCVAMIMAFKSKDDSDNDDKGIRGITNRWTVESCRGKENWIMLLGSLRNKGKNYDEMARGLSTLTFFERMLDKTTKKILKTHMSNKQSIYSVVRWLFQNYIDLRKKDNLDLKNKRLRRNEYIASLLTKEFSDRLSRIIGLGNRVTIEKIEEIFSFPGTILLQQLHKSGILRFDDKINDMDLFSKLRYTLKGPNSLGGKNSKNISTKYKGLHPSYIGLLDINVCGTTDPGSSGLITPFAKTHGLFFDDAHEAEAGIFNMLQESSEYFNKQDNGMLNIDPMEGVETVDDMHRRIEKMRGLEKLSSSKTYRHPKRKV